MKVKQLFNTCKVKLDKNAPAILVVTGVIGMIGATVLACRATIKAKDIKEDTRAQLEVIDACEKEGRTINDDNEEVSYSPEEAKADRKVVKVKAWLRYGKIFAPAVLLGTVSIGAILFGHNILNRRYISLGSAYTALDKAYAEYRNRVADKYGEEAEKDIRYGYGTEDKKTEDPELAETPLSPERKLDCSPYARFFDSSCHDWTKDAEQNLYFLRLQQARWNRVLEEEGRVMLNDVYKSLGFDLTREGQRMGWLRDKDHPNTYIDFGIYDIDKPRNRAFVDGYENVILLDFNITGNVIDSFPTN